VDVVAGKLFAMLTDDTETIVIDLKTRKQEATLPCGLQIISPESPYGHQVYFNSGGKVSVTTSTRASTKKFARCASADRIVLGEVRRVRISRRHARRAHGQRDGSRDSTQDRQERRTRPRRAAQHHAHPIHHRGTGREDLRWRLSRRRADALRPANRQARADRQRRPAEGMGVYGDHQIFMGIYPRARLKVFDVTKPCSDENPKQIEELDRFDQDRPFAVLGVESLKKVFFGTISDYGTLGGALSVYDVETGKTEVHRNVVQDQSVSSLAYCDGMIVGGTTIAGGLGIKPKEKEAKLFLWDPKTNEKVFETVPTPARV
jgi:hypothetical protein